MNFKICAKCDINKHFSEYNRHSSGVMKSVCKVCVAADKRKHYDENKSSVLQYQKDYRKKCPDIIRDAHYRKHYNITLNYFLELEKAQGGLCKICQRPESTRDQNGKVKPLHVDHCHKTGEVRGLLCCKCNRGLGHFFDDVLLFERAIIYLKGS